MAECHTYDIITISMKKTASKNKQTINNKYNITVIFGYGLFALIVLSTVLWTVIPLSNSLFYPTSRHFNIIALIISFAAAAILPALASYIIGDRATHKKNKVLHHYNGVLFGVAAFWAATALSFVAWAPLASISQLPVPFSTMLASAVPILIAICVMTFVAITYAKKRKNTFSVLQHRPYQVVLICSVLVLNISLLISGNYNVGVNIWDIIAPYIYLVGLIVISYLALAKYHVTRSARLTDAFVAMSFSYITMTTISEYIAFLNLHWSVTLLWSYIIAIVVWVVYLYLRNRKVV
jgi:hypothetical protein